MHDTNVYITLNLLVLLALDTLRVYTFFFIVNDAKAQTVLILRCFDGFTVKRKIKLSMLVVILTLRSIHSCYFVVVVFDL